MLAGFGGLALCRVWPWPSQPRPSSQLDHRRPTNQPPTWFGFTFPEVTAHPLCWECHGNDEQALHTRAWGGFTKDGEDARNMGDSHPVATYSNYESSSSHVFFFLMSLL